MTDRRHSKTRQWWDDVDYSQSDVQPLWSMSVEAPEKFDHPCGFIKLKERHRIPASRSHVNAQDSHCRIGRVWMKTR